MTPGETALWLRNTFDLDLDLEVARMRGYRRDRHRRDGWPPWIPPSPGIVSWESARCYAATVMCEAVPALDFGRGTALPFQLVGATWMEGERVCRALAATRLPGVRFHPHLYRPGGSGQARPVDGVRLTVTDPGTFRPARTAVTLLCCLRDLYGPRRLWRGSKALTRHFDDLFGTGTVRRQIRNGGTPASITRGWRPALRTFRKSREPCLLYQDA
jgi:uncharacterized protein YbbC (DUF1343 family)